MHVSNWVTYDDVVEAASAIAASNEIPTIIRLREYLGRGSNTTLQKYLNKWRQNQPQTHSEPPDAVNMAVKQVWDKINSTTQEEITRIKDDYEFKLSEARDQIQRLEHERAHFANEWSISKQSLSELTSSVEKLKHEKLNQQVTLDLNAQKISYLEREIISLKDAHTQALSSFKICHEKLELEFGKVIAEERQIKKDEMSSLIARHEGQRHQWIVDHENLKVANERLKFELQNETNDKRTLEVSNAELICRISGQDAQMLTLNTTLNRVESEKMILQTCLFNSIKNSEQAKMELTIERQKYSQLQNLFDYQVTLQSDLKELKDRVTQIETVK